MGNQIINRMLKLKSRPMMNDVSSENFELVEEKVRDIEEGEILVKNLYLSFDPTQRGWLNDVPSYIPPVQIGEVMRAGSVGKVIESKNQNFSEDDIVQGSFGWQEYAISGEGSGFMPPQKLPEGISPTSALSIYGITGLTAYFGMLDIGKPEQNDTVLVSGAAGATGSVAGQIAKIKGATNIIGIAGGPEKCKWVVEEAGFDSCIDYKNENVAKRVTELAPNGLNIYFDNVGGETLNIMTRNLAMHARIVLCGFMTQYNLDSPPPGPNLGPIVGSRATIRGVVVYDHYDKQDDFISIASDWLKAGKIDYIEDEVFGLDNAPAQFCKLMRGENFGKTIVTIQ